MFKNWSIKRFLVILAALLLGFSFIIPSVYAKGGSGGGGGKGGSPGPGFEPRGWDEGKKKGWKGGEEPPGLAKQDKDKDKNKDKDKKRKNKHKREKEEKKENEEAKEHEKEKREK